MDAAPPSADLLPELRGEVREVQADAVSHALEDAVRGIHSLASPPHALAAPVASLDLMLLSMSSGFFENLGGIPDVGKEMW